MSDIRFISDITVEELQAVGGDTEVVAAARVSTRGWDSMPQEESSGLIRFLIRGKHGTPFEHGLLTVRCHCPVFVWWEMVRHRFLTVGCTDLGFSMESARYRELEPVFWVPRKDRPMMPVEGFKAARPELTAATPASYRAALAHIQDACSEAWVLYLSLRSGGIAREVARSVLPFGIYYSGWVSGNPRAWLHFLSLRTHHKNAAAVSFPQAEIEEAANQIEELFQKRWPLTHAAWQEFGRCAP